VFALIPYLALTAAINPLLPILIAGHVLQGLTTSLMLIAAVPPLVVGWPASKMPWTGFVMNLCIFGAVALGPVIGGIQAGAASWRPLFWIVAGFGVLALLFALLTFEDQAPQDPSAPRDWVGLVLAGGGAAAAFFGASELLTHRMLDVIVFVPLAAGAAMIRASALGEGGPAQHQRPDRVPAHRAGPPGRTAPEAGHPPPAGRGAHRRIGRRGGRDVGRGSRHERCVTPPRSAR
jgi:MFS family permease